MKGARVNLADIFEDDAYLKTFNDFRTLPAPLLDWYSWDSLRTLQPRDDLSVLDVGAGRGQFSGPLLRHARQISSQVRISLLERSGNMCVALQESTVASTPEIAVVHNDFAEFSAAPENHGKYDLIFLSESVHLLGSWPAALSSLVAMSAANSAIAIRLCTREQVANRSMFRWYPAARQIDMDRHPSLHQIEEAIHDLNLSLRLQIVDESHWLTRESYRSLLASRSFSSLHMMDEAEHWRGTAQMLRDTKDMSHIWLDYPMTWAVITNPERGHSRDAEFAAGAQRPPT
jgi:SAM-dependent methyltransferase